MEKFQALDSQNLCSFRSQFGLEFRWVLHLSHLVGVLSPGQHSLVSCFRRLVISELKVWITKSITRDDEYLGMSLGRILPSQNHHSESAQKSLFCRITCVLVDSLSYDLSDVRLPSGARKCHANAFIQRNDCNVHWWVSMVTWSHTLKGKPRLSGIEPSIARTNCDPTGSMLWNSTVCCHGES